MKRVLVLVVSVVAATSSLMVTPVPVHADNFSIGINVGAPPPPPAIVLSAPPPLVVVPGTPVYYAPSLSVNFFAYGGQYYSHHNGGREPRRYLCPLAWPCGLRGWAGDHVGRQDLRGRL